MSGFTPDQLNELRQLILSTTTDASKGRYAGFGNPQFAPYHYEDNCTASFPWNFDFVIPQNFQRWVSVKLSFKLRAFRQYDSGVATATTSATPHYHTWVQPGVAKTIAYQLGMDSGGVPGMSGALPPPFGFKTATETAGPQAFSSFTSIDSNGAGHTHTVTPTLNPGIFETTTPTSVTLAIDGVDQTATLGGPWTTDTVELDITKVVPTTLGQFHEISLTPDQNGRITGSLFFYAFVDGSIAP